LSKKRDLRKRKKYQEKKKLVLEERRKDKEYKAIFDKQKKIKYLSEEEKKQKQEEAADKLKHNYKILQSLEAEYDKEMLERSNLHEKLEKEGAESLEDKMNLISKKVKKLEKGSKKDWFSSRYVCIVTT